MRWVVPPVVHKKVWKLGLVSATLDGLLKRALPDAELHDLPPVELVDGARVYQLRTHKAPRRTVYDLELVTDETTGKEKWVPIRLSKTGQRLWHLVEQQIRTTPEKKHGIISYKQVLEWIEPEIKELQIQAVANFGGLVGLDTKFESVDTLWVLFSPELPPGELEWRAKMLFGNDDDPLSFQRNKDGTFTDARVQQVYDAGVIAELLQAIGRARLVLHAREVVLLCAHPLPGISERAILFDETDWQVAGGLSNLAQVVADREAAEAELKTIADYQQAYDCSERHARRLWELAGGKEKKANTDAERLQRLLELKALGIGERKIAETLGISYGKVRKLLKNAQVH